MTRHKEKLQKVLVDLKETKEIIRVQRKRVYINKWFHIFLDE